MNRDQRRESNLNQTYADLYRIIEERQIKKKSLPIRKRMRKVLMSQVYLIVLVIATLLALFFDDFRHLVASKTTDDVFYGITTAIIIFFLLGRDLGVVYFSGVFSRVEGKLKFIGRVGVLGRV